MISKTKPIYKALVQKIKICAKRSIEKIVVLNNIDSLPHYKTKIKVFTIVHLKRHEAHRNIGRHMWKDFSEIRCCHLRKD